jgi:hypothetical protein
MFDFAFFTGKKPALPGIIVAKQWAQYSVFWNTRYATIGIEVLLSEHI